MNLHQVILREEVVLPHFGFESRKNAAKVAAALIKIGSPFVDTEAELKAAKDTNAFRRGSNFGINYFYFKTKAAEKRAAKVAKEIIDKTEESEWGE